MKILHTADWHFGERDHDEIKKCLDFMIEYAQENVPDLFVVSGDITDSRYLNLDSRSARTIFNIVNAMLEMAPVAVVIGTPSHDGSAALALRECRGEYPIFVSAGPEQLAYISGCHPGGMWVTIKDIVEKKLDPDFILSQIPQPTKQYFINDLAIEDTDMAISNAMNSILTSFGDLPEGLRDTPHIVNGHFQVGGAFISETQQLIGRDIELSVSQLNMLNADLICLGHIHKAQKLGDNIYYAGSPTRMNFGETEDKGFYHHNLKYDFLGGDPAKEKLIVRDLNSKFIQTPAKQMLEIKEDFTNDEDSIKEIDIVLYSYSPDELKDADIKITLTMWQDEARVVKQTEIKGFFIDSGCRNVKLSLIRKPREAVRAEKVLEAETLPEKLKAMTELRGEDIADSILEKAKSLESEDPEPWKMLDNLIK